MISLDTMLKSSNIALFKKKSVYVDFVHWTNGTLECRSRKMWYNGDNNGMNMNMNMNPNPMLNINSMANMDMNLNPNFDMNPINNHDMFDFSLHSSNMQQGTESASPAIGVSIFFCFTLHTIITIWICTPFSIIMLDFRLWIYYIN